MRVRLKLKQPYTWPSRNPNKPNSNQYGFIETIDTLAIGQIVTFENLHPYSNAGDLNTDHYKYFEGKSYKVSTFTNSKRETFYDLIEV